VDILEFQAGQLEQQYQYQSFSPSLINHPWSLRDDRTLAMLENASRLLGELNAFSQLVPDVDFFIRMHITKEATTSSRIEGTQTNMEEALISEHDVDPEKHDDWQEVQNYIQAMNQSMKTLDDLPLSNRLLREIHKTLMQGVRGKHKQPGEFRVSQNWIGTSLKNAIFVPPHHDRIPDLMSDLELFIHNDQDYVPHLIKIAILHYQFETIHPFLDGNGRLGRLLIALYLVSSNLLTKPALYLSDFFERHKGEYYDHLMATRTTNNLLAWIQFFLIGIEETAKKSISVFKEIIELRATIEQEKLPIFHTRKQENARTLIQYLYRYPVVNRQEISEILSIQHSTATALVSDFEKAGILKELTGQKRNKLFVFDDYIRLFN
jgi:Fic family protein